MTALKRTPSWDEAKKALGDGGFMEKLIGFNKDTLDDAMIKKLSKFTSNKEFSPESVGKVSGAARGMCLWVHAMKVIPTSLLFVAMQSYLRMNGLGFSAHV
jgi:dynein heavy chain, axonemal